MSPGKQRGGCVRAVPPPAPVSVTPPNPAPQAQMVAPCAGITLSICTAPRGGCQPSHPTACTRGCTEGSGHYFFFAGGKGRIRLCSHKSFKMEAKKEPPLQADTRPSAHSSRTRLSPALAQLLVTQNRVGDGVRKKRGPKVRLCPSCGAGGGGEGAWQVCSGN